MKYIKKILAVLPQDHDSPALLNWCRVLAEATDAGGIDFIHGLPQPLAVFPAEENDSVAREAEEKFAREVTTELGQFDCHIETSTEALLGPTLHRLSGGEYDLVLVSALDFPGRTLANRLAQKSPVGVLMIPNEMTLPPRRILAPIDFSDISKLIINRAEEFATLAPEGECQLEAIHLTEVPISGRATVAISPEALKKLVLDTEEDNLMNFIRENTKNPDSWKRTLETGYSFGEELAEKGKSADRDLMIIGCQGRNALSVAMLGSQAAEVIRNAECPVLIVKQKNASLGFLRQLLGLS